MSDSQLSRSYRTLKYNLSAITGLPPSTIDIILPSIGTAAATVTLIYVYRNYLKRYPDSNSLPPHFFRRKTLFGKVVAVGDADNFRIYHTPGGKWAGWGWIPGRKVPENRKELKGQTIHVRIAGVDAPEGAHFGKPSQPHSQESLKYLTNLLQSKFVRAHLLRRDQYERVVCSVSIKRKGVLGFLGFKHDLGLQMLTDGMAQVYESMYGVEFGRQREKMEKKYREAEKDARGRKVGIWGMKGAYESPGQYKTRMASLEGSSGGKGIFTASSVVETAGKEREEKESRAQQKRTMFSTSAVPKATPSQMGLPTTAEKKSKKPTTEATVKKVVVEEEKVKKRKKADIELKGSKSPKVIKPSSKTSKQKHKS